jgi:RNA polymerase sigma-70 factor (ECF subfamily)
MSNEQLWNAEIRQARRGSEESVNWLTRQAQERVRAYIFRVTLDNDLTDDLPQDTLLQMIRSIRQLKDEESFWPWLYRIAQNKIQEHYRSKKRETLISENLFYDDILSRRGDLYRDESLRELIKQDLLKKVMIAMKQLKQQHRAILSLRCFDNLSYAEIADTIDCNEMTARILFYRARKALRKKLSNQGISKNLMLMSLGLFGRLTLPPNVSSSVPSGPVSKISVQVGPAAAILSALSSKKAAVLAIAIVILLTFLLRRDYSSLPPFVKSTTSSIIIPARNEINSLHFTVQILDSDPNADGSLSKGAYERWFYFPEGIDGPAFMRMQRYTADLSEKLCAWLENGDASYYYNSDSHTVYITNSRVCWSNLKVRRLPTDSEEFINFLREVEGEPDAYREYIRDEKTGLVTSSVDYRFVNAFSYKTDYEFNTIGPELFQYKWDEPVSDFVDQRDQMHKRGWTYFRIDGQLNGKKVTGKGRIPFVYKTCKEYPAWLKIDIDGELEILDCQYGAQLKKADEQIIENYPSGTFLKGLSRSWMGFHSADVVRRDAVEKQIWFFSEWDEKEENVIITLFDKKSQNGTKIIYTIDYENDIIENMLFMSGTDTKGYFEFTYFQNIADETSDEFTEPEVSKTSYNMIQESPGILWLINLAEGRLH